MRPALAAGPTSSWEQRTPTTEAAIEDPAATFSRLYGEYFDFVWRVVRGCGVHPTQLEDAVHDAFVVVHRRLPDFEPNASHKTWLFAISARVAKDYRRRTSRKGGLLPLEATAGLPAESDPFEAAARAEVLRAVDACLEALDDDKRDVFLLAEIEQMTAPEIAETLGVKLNTVYSRLRAARRSFAEALVRFDAERLGGQK